MERVKSIVPMMAFIVCLTKSLITGMGSNDVLALLVLAGLYGFIEFGIQYKKVSSLQLQIDDLSSKNGILEKRVDEVKSNVSGLKLSQNIRQSQTTRI